MMITPSQMRLRYMSVPGPVLLPQWSFPCQISSVKYDANFFYLFFSGGIHFIASNNDCGVRDFDMESFELSKHFRYPWPVNVRVLHFPSLVIWEMVSVSIVIVGLFFWEWVFLYLFIWLQHTSLSPDGKLLVIVGDDPDGILVDAKTGKVIYSSTSCLLSSFYQIYLNSLYLPEYSFFADNHAVMWAFGFLLCIGVAPRWCHLCYGKPGQNL